MHLTGGAVICESPLARWNVAHKHIEIADGIEDWINEQEEVILQSRNTSDPGDQRVITRRLSMILAKRETFRGINDEATKSTCLLLITLLQQYDCTEEALSLIQRFACDYTKDRRAALGPGDPRNPLENLHLAASLGDNLAISIMVTGETPFKINASTLLSAGEHKDHTPLELYAWYCKDEDDCVELLLESGADECIPATLTIAARRGLKKLLQTFESWRPAHFRRSIDTLLCLARNGGHIEVASWLVDLGQSGRFPLPLFEIEDPLTKYLARR